MNPSTRVGAGNHLHCVGLVTSGLCYYTEESAKLPHGAACSGSLGVIGVGR